MDWGLALVIGAAVAYLWVAHVQESKLGEWLSTIAAAVNVAIFLTAAFLLSLAFAYVLQTAR
jgi:hypothetical protein